MTELFNKPTAPLKLTDLELEQLRHSIPRSPHDRGSRSFLKGVTDAQLADAEYLRRGWDGLLRACRKLTEPRLRAVLNRLAEGYTTEELRWAIKAYAQEVNEDAWRRANPQARLTFEMFLTGGRLELYVEIGDQRREAEKRISIQRAQRSADRKQQAAAERLMTEFERMPADRQKTLIGQAVTMLATRGFSRVAGTMRNPIVRNVVLKLTQQEQHNQAAPSIGQALEESMS